MIPKDQKTVPGKRSLDDLPDERKKNAKKPLWMHFLNKLLDGWQKKSYAMQNTHCSRLV